MNPLSRIALVGLPLVVIALLAGGAGYLTADTKSTPIPQLPQQEEPVAGVRGTLQGFSNDRITLVASDGTTLLFDLPGESTVERLVAIAREDLDIGDWLNGGAIAHPETILALVGLVLISDPVVQTP